VMMCVCGCLNQDLILTLMPTSMLDSRICTRPSAPAALDDVGRFLWTTCKSCLLYSSRTNIILLTNTSASSYLPAVKTFNLNPSQDPTTHTHSIHPAPTSHDVILQSGECNYLNSVPNLPLSFSHPSPLTSPHILVQDEFDIWPGLSTS
jgi:hypothetical protein